MTALVAQVAAEVRMTLRNAESLLLALGIPVALLVFFSLVDVLPRPADVADPVDFLAPGILALAVLSTSMVSLAIATGFERSYGVLKRLHATPLGRPRLVAAKIATVVAVLAVQLAVLVPVALVLGWRPDPSVGVAAAAVMLAAIAFGGIGLLLAGTLPALTTLAAANAVYIVLLLLGGFVVPLEQLPDSVAGVSRLLPAAALSDALRAAFGDGDVPARAWVVLAGWAVLAPAAAARVFRWE